MARVNPPSEEDSLRMHLKGKRNHALPSATVADLSHRALAKLHMEDHIRHEHTLDHTHAVNSPMLRIPAVRS